MVDQADRAGDPGTRRADDRASSLRFDGQRRGQQGCPRAGEDERDDRLARRRLDRDLRGHADCGQGLLEPGSQVGASALSAAFYPTDCRASGVSWANGVGRMGSVAGSLAGGAMLAMGLTMPALFLLARRSDWLMLAGSVTQAYIAYARARDLVTVAEQTVTQQQDILKLTTDRVPSGLETEAA